MYGLYFCQILLNFSNFQCLASKVCHSSSQFFKTNYDNIKTSLKLMIILKLCLNVVYTCFIYLNITIAPLREFLGRVTIFTWLMKITD